MDFRNFMTLCLEKKSNKKKSNKKKFLIFLFFFFFLFLIYFSLAAKIYGEIYDLGLNKIKNVFIVINTTPEQKMISVDGSYIFQVPLGIYEIRAFYKIDNTLYHDFEIVKIDKEGNYRIDFILTEFLDEIFINDTKLNELIDILDLLESPKKTKINWIFWFILILILLATLTFIILVLLKLRKRKEKEAMEKVEAILKQPDKFKKTVLDILEKEKRILQKDLRKKLNVSEAKLSLLITELEEEGKVKKIKRGRGNILIYQE